jgi:N-acyl-D-amino-acid deacylase
MTDLVVRGGSIVDGTGRAPYVADVRVVGGVIVEIGMGLNGATEIDAGGCVVAPGFIDLHTHYDPQVLWDPWVSPSSMLGVTSVVAGNCGFSVAPCRPESRGSLIRTFENVEDMRSTTLDAGIDWSFETYPEYLEAVALRGTAINFGGYVGHTALRLWAMGDEGWERPATAAELDQMRAVLGEALGAGAVGFSTDRSPFHRGDGGRRVPSAIASQDEVEALMRVCGTTGRGLVHCAPGEDFGWLYDFQPTLGRPITWSAILAYPPEAQSKAYWGDKLRAHRAGLAAGADVHPQVTCRPITMSFTLADPTVYAMVPAFASLLARPSAQRAEIYRDLAWREQAGRELHERRFVDPRFETMTIAESQDPGLVGQSIDHYAAEQRRDPFDAMCEIALGEQLATRFSVTFANDDESSVRSLLLEEGCVLGLSDAGAHSGQLCDAALPVDYLSDWVRDRNLVPIEAGVRRVTGELADLIGLPARGYVKTGYFADLVVLDWSRLGRGPVRRVRDLPGGDDRLVTDRPTGIVHVLVNGVPIRRDEHILDAHERLPGGALLATTNS